MAKTIAGQLNNVELSLSSIEGAVAVSGQQISQSIEGSTKKLVEVIESTSPPIEHRVDEVSQSILSSTNKLHTSISTLESSLNTSFSELHTQVESISIAINSAADGVTLKTALFTILMAFIGSGSAFLFNFLHSRLEKKIENIAALAKAYVDSVESIQHTSIKYWLQPSDEAKTIDIELLEMQINSHLKVCREHTKVLSNLLKTKSTIGRSSTYEKEITALESFKVEIYDLTTGGSFGSAIRSIDRERAGAINKECSQITASLSKLIYIR